MKKQLLDGLVKVLDSKHLLIDLLLMVGGFNLAIYLTSLSFIHTIVSLIQ